MRLSKLDIHGFRNLHKLSFEASPSLTLFTGDNAAGKTSLLEAIFFLGHARSFRTHLPTELIQREQAKLQLLAQLEDSYLDDRQGRAHILGIERSRQQTRIRFDREPVKRLSDIASRFPVLAIHPDSYHLVTGSPAQRRKFLDWGVFHVEHDFLPLWQRFRKSLLQRNAALRKRLPVETCTAWDGLLAQDARAIDRLRENYIAMLRPFFEALACELFPGKTLMLEYRRGWSSELAYDEQLARQLDSDRQRGFTGQGPHRAEIVLRLDGQSAQTGISRGQQKALVALLKLAQAQHFSHVRQQPCVLLYDDLPAELDRQYRERILTILSGMSIQLFLTAIEPSQLSLDAWPDLAMFHVEQGRLG